MDNVAVLGRTTFPADYPRGGRPEITLSFLHRGTVLYRSALISKYKFARACASLACIQCVSVLVYRTDTTDVPTLHRSGSNPPALDTLPSSDRAGHGRRPAVSQPFGWEGNSGPFQEERQSAQGHQ
jgi:hypothetical protein